MLQTNTACSLPVYCTIAVAVFSILGVVFFCSGWLALFPFLLLLTPMKDQRTKVLVIFNVVAIFFILLLQQIFGSVTFTTGTGYYFLEIVNLVIPFFATVLVLINSRFFGPALLYVLIPASFLLFSVFFWLLFLYLVHWYKWPRRIQFVFTVPASVLLLVCALVFALFHFDYVRTNEINTHELIREARSGNETMRVYRTNYLGALSHYGIVIRRERQFFPGAGLCLVRGREEFYRTTDAYLEPLEDGKVFYRTFGESANSGFI